MVYPTVLNDMIGLDSGNRGQRRVYMKDVEMALKGHIMDGYTVRFLLQLLKWKKQPTKCY